MVPTRSAAKETVTAQPNPRRSQQQRSPRRESERHKQKGGNLEPLKVRLMAGHMGLFEVKGQV